MKQKGFDTKRYIHYQTEAIKERTNRYDRLYLEFGGKLFSDLHASRVLPGYQPETKLKLLKQLPRTEIIYCINAKDVQKERIISDFNLPYALHAIKDINRLEKAGIDIKKIVITRFTNESKAIKLIKLLKKRKYSVYIHKEIKGYPLKIEKVVKAFRQQTYIPVTQKIIVITAPASGSGKMAVALNQLYHEYKNNINSGFAKCETFPIWNLPLKHPINQAYEAATADLGDKNMIDPYHKKAYGQIAINYNRDIENFYILKKITAAIAHPKKVFPYRSPTDMGINKAKKGIINEETCKKAAYKEIERRNVEYKKQYEEDKTSYETIQRMNKILKEVEKEITREQHS